MPAMLAVAYFPFAFFNVINPILSFIYAILGFQINHTDESAYMVAIRYLVLIPIIGLALAAAMLFIFGGIKLLELIWETTLVFFGLIPAPGPEPEHRAQSAHRHDARDRRRAVPACGRHPVGGHRLRQDGHHPGGPFRVEPLVYDTAIDYSGGLRAGGRGHQRGAIVRTEKFMEIRSRFDPFNLNESP